MASEEKASNPVAPESPAAKRVLGGLLAVVLGLLAWRLAALLTLAFGAVVLSLGLRGLAQLLARVTRIAERWAVLPVVVLLVIAFTAVGWLFGAQIGAQFDILVKRLPEIFAAFQRDLAQRPWGLWLIEQIQGVDLPSATSVLAGRIGAFFSTTLRGAAYAAVLISTGIFLAVQPARYRQGVLQLVPPARRERAAEILGFAGDVLQRWLVGQSLTMLAVGALTTLGLWALGVSAPVALGLISGTFAFVPYVGPVAAAVPSVLMALTQSPWLALYTILLYGAVHFVEGDVITPLIQNETVRLPPALTIFAAAVFGVLLGPLGVLLAAPLMILLLVAVQTLYIEDVLGEQRTWPSPKGHKHPLPESQA